MDPSWVKDMADSKRKRNTSTDQNDTDESRKQRIGDDYIDKLSLQGFLKKYDLPLQRGTLSEECQQQLDTKATAWILQRNAQIENPTTSASSANQREEVDIILEATRRIGILDRNASRAPLQAKLFACCWTYKIHIDLPALFQEALFEIQVTLQKPEPQRQRILELLVRMKRLLEGLNREREFVEPPARDLVLQWLDIIERDLFTHRNGQFLSHALRKPGGIEVPMDALRENFARDAGAAALRHAQNAGQDENSPMDKLVRESASLLGNVSRSMLTLKSV